MTVMYKAVVKRLIDILAAFILLVVVSPVILLTTALLFIANSGSPFFSQIRPGKAGKLFRVLKFKTMNDMRDASGKLLPDVERLTSIGKFVRSTSLDELPQLWNVLIGDMSLVGPRPLLEKYLPLYDKRQIRRHEVRPGITGWAQVNGRNTISWQERFELDVFYVEHVSFVLDCKILLLTLQKVLKREGINADGSATMKAFTGNTK